MHVFPAPVVTDAAHLHEILVLLSIKRLVTATPPIVTLVAPVKLFPVIVNEVVELPDAGLMLLTLGAAV